MADFILYLIESSAVLTFFYAVYALAMRTETFFNLNRFFLLGTLLISLTFPLLSFDVYVDKVAAVENPLNEISKIRISYYEAMALWEFDSRTFGESQPVRNLSMGFLGEWKQMLLLAAISLYAFGVVVCLSRTGYALRWIFRLINANPRETFGGLCVVKLKDPTASFSFLNYVFVHEAIVGTAEFRQILDHEKTHIQQKHSIDLIFVQCLAAFFWFNPVIWQLIKSLKTTHEYIADKKIISSGYSFVEYQTLLLKQLISSNSFGLVHNFNLSFIKKRIAMMKNKKSGWHGKVKVAVAIACTSLFCIVLIQCNSKLDEQDSNDAIVSASTADKINLPVLVETGYKYQGNDSGAVEFIIRNNILSINGVRVEAEEIKSWIEKNGIPTLQGHTVMNIDKAQPMAFVRIVENELRKANRRKIVYRGQTVEGDPVESAIVLPPPPHEAPFPDADKLFAEGKLDLLKVYIRDNDGAANQEKVYDFVMRHIQKKSSDYVVSVKYNDDDSYQNYLSNLVYVQEGFHKIYQERAQQMFSKDYFGIDKDEYKAVRNNIPMAISIEEKY